MNRQFLSAALLLVWASALPGVSAAAEKYDNCTGFIDSVPAVISTQGVWCLRADLATAIDSGSAISVGTNNVTIDCNDFKLGGLAAGPATQAHGISATNRQNVTIRRCAIRGFSRGIAIFGANSAGHLVEKNRLDGIRRFGILLQSDGSSMIRNNRVVGTGGDTEATFVTGIVASAHIIDNTVDGVAGIAPNTIATGISAGSLNPGLVVSGNRVRGLSTHATGRVIGISALGSHAQVMSNKVATNTADADHYGIQTELGNFCLTGGNRVSGFATPYWGQTANAGPNYSN